MPENDELRAAEERLRQFYAWAHNHYEGDPPNPYHNEKPVTMPTTELMADDKEEIVQAYLAHPPLTRERLEKAVVELFSGRGEQHDWMELLSEKRIIISGFTLSSMTDRLCRLLGVDSP